MGSLIEKIENLIYRDMEEENEAKKQKILLDAHINELNKHSEELTELLQKVRA